jgi:hypothetical protein
MRVDPLRCAEVSAWRRPGRFDGNPAQNAELKRVRADRSEIDEHQHHPTEYHGKEDRPKHRICNLGAEHGGDFVRQRDEVQDGMSTHPPCAADPRGDCSCESISISTDPWPVVCSGSSLSGLTERLATAEQGRRRRAGRRVRHETAGLDRVARSRRLRDLSVERSLGKPRRLSSLPSMRAPGLVRESGFQGQRLSHPFIPLSRQALRSVRRLVLR